MRGLVDRQKVFAGAAVDVQNVPAVYGPGRCADQFTGIASEQVRDLIALADCVLETVRTCRPLVGPTGENVEAR
jgi:hypothetical protein